MITQREKFRRITGLESTSRCWDYSRDRALFYHELVRILATRRGARCRDCPMSLRIEVVDCENCERWIVRLGSATWTRKQLH